MPPRRPVSVILIVVGTLAAVTLLYASTLTYCACNGIAIPDAVGTAFKDFALVSLGALGALLTRTSTHDSPADPVPAKIVNTPAEPIPTDPQP